MMKPGWYRACAAFALAICAGAHAEDGSQLSGFATLGLTRGDDDLLGLRRDIAREDGADAGDWRVDTDSVLGLQWNAAFGRTFDLTVQAVLKDRVEQNFDETIEGAFLRYRPREGSELRLGRMALDTFLLSDYRQVGYAYPWIRAVPDFYAPIPIYHFDGVDFTQRFGFDEGATRVDVKAYGGVSSILMPDATQAGNGKFRFELEPLWGVLLAVEHAPWGARLSFTQASSASDLPLEQLRAGLALAAPVWPAANTYRDDLLVEGQETRYTSAGLAYDDGSWLAQAEVARLDSETPMSLRQDMGYVSAGRRVGAVTLYATLAATRPPDDYVSVALPPTMPPFLAVLIEPLRAGTETAFNAARAEQWSFGAGVRWDFAPRRALKLQWDRWRVEPDGTLLWTADGGAPMDARTVNVVAVALELVF